MIHLVYPHDPARIAAPWSIGNNVAAGLRERGYEVRQYDWDESLVITPSSRDDVLLGHPHPDYPRVGPFQASLAGPWRKRVAMAPFNGSARGVAFAESWIGEVDGFLAICGPHWAAKLPGQWCATPVDMAVDRLSFPRVVTFAEPGQRSIAYVGCTVPDKGTDFLAALSERVQGTIYHYGYGAVGGRVVEMGHYDFHQVIPSGNLLVATGRNDANPTSVLEGACWGMVALCTPQSGWGEDVALHLPLDNVESAAGILNYWLTASTAMLESRRAKVDAALERYTWKRFVDKVAAAIS